MTITITAFERSPDGGKGLARDTRVRWALEEVAEPYQVRLLSFRALKQSAHLALHPFGQIPTCEEGELALFESGAIVFHIAERHAGLLPDNANARAGAIAWMFAALSTVEPPILELGTARLLEGDKPWSAERLPLVKDRLGSRLEELSVRLGDAEWLDGAFSAGDLMMVSVLLRLKPSGTLGWQVINGDSIFISDNDGYIWLENNTTEPDPCRARGECRGRRAARAAVAGRMGSGAARARAHARWRVGWS